MANTASAKKRARQALTRRNHNAAQRTMVRTCVKNVYKALEAGNADLAEQALVAAIPVIDRIADKGIIHKNKAARHKSRLVLQVKKLKEKA